MDQITAVVEWVAYDGEGLMETSYVADCGCRWRVDMRGNVRMVHVCRACMAKEKEDIQWALNLVAEPE